jgi:signal transduction histidine kinase
MPMKSDGVAWQRSLFLRIALGYVISLALLLTAQWIIFIQLADRRDRSSDVDRLDRLEVAQKLGKQLSDSLERSPADLAQLVSSLPTSEHVFIITRDGRVIGHRHPSAATVRIVVDGLERVRQVEQFPRVWARTDFGAVPVTRRGEVIGILGIMPPSTFERYSKSIVAVTVSLLIVGTVALSLIIVAPIRLRLRDLQAAAARLRDGDLSARASPRGSDEIADVAEVFNEMAEELSRRTSDLETSDRLRRQLIADVSHELMTPLTVVLGHLETLSMDEVNLDKSQRLHQVEIATREARRLERLIGDLLNAARLEGGVTPLEIDNVDLRALFGAVTSRHEQECRLKEISVSTSVAPDLATVRADPFRIEQVAENLLINAIRHTPKGGAIELHATSGTDHVLLQVKDSGEGIHPDHLPYVFDRFYKVSSADEIASPGSGLGLSIVKAIVQRHGGRVGAVSELGRGTTVSVELPFGAKTA